MNEMLHHGMLLAQKSRLDSLSSGFKGQRARLDLQEIVTAALIVAGFALAMWLLTWYLNHREGRRGYTSPRRLFWALCQAHRLPWRQRWLLWRVARAQKLSDPARLFLEPEWLQPDKLAGASPAQAAQLMQLRESLFVEPPPNQDLADEKPPEEEPLPVLDEVDA
jgi:hypothetical protein